MGGWWSVRGGVVLGLKPSKESTELVTSAPSRRATRSCLSRSGRYRKQRSRKQSTGHGNGRAAGVVQSVEGLTSLTKKTPHPPSSPLKEDHRYPVQQKSFGILLSDHF